MDYFTVVLITGFVVGLFTWAKTKDYVEEKWEKKWMLGICHDEKGWRALLERHLSDRHWEYIYINKENLALITHIAFSNVPAAPNPIFSKEDRIYQMMQDMVNRGHGHIIGIKKEENSN